MPRILRSFTALTMTACATALLAVAATAGTPDAIIARLESEIRRALSQPQVVAAYENAGLTVRFMGAAEFGKFWDAEIAKFALAIKHSGAVKE